MKKTLFTGGAHMNSSRPTWALGGPGPGLNGPGWAWVYSSGLHSAAHTVFGLAAEWATGAGPAC
jgi:hypothetical protein